VITINGADDAPVVSNVTATASYTQGNPAVTLSSGATVSDVDNAFLQSATVSISIDTFFAGDILSADVTGTSITKSYNATTGVLTLTGNDTLAHYQQVLESVTYVSTSSNPTNFGVDPTRTISWVVNDGTLDSTTQTTTLNIIGSTVTIPAGSTSTLNGGTLQANVIDVEGTLIGFGKIIANVITNNGTITAKSAHTLEITINGSITGTGTLELTNNTTLTLNGPVGPDQTVLFDIGGGAVKRLVLGDPSYFQAQLENFQINDQIDLTNINPLLAHVSTTQPPSYDPIKNITTLVITDGTNTDTLKLVGDYTPPAHNFNFSSDGSGGTIVVDPPASTTTADAITIPDASTTTIDASTATTVASTTDGSATTADATVTPVAKTSTPTAAKTTNSQTKASSVTATDTASSRTNATLAAVDEAVLVALNTAVVVATALDNAAAATDA